MQRTSSIRMLRRACSATLILAVLAGGEPPARADGPWGGEGTWAFQPGEELEGGALDLRGLNENVAGQDGFVRRSADGEGFVRADGRPIRFWGVAARVNPKVPDEEIERHARFLARIGVNMVRLGGADSGLYPTAKDARITDVNEDALNDVWRAVAIFKKHGIYVRYSPFWDHGSVKYVPESWGIEGYGGKGGRLNALLFFEPTLQKGYRAWMRRLLCDKNPYTGIPLKDDPALAIVQVVSEDSLLFWWFNSIKGGPLKELQGRFAAFAKGKYGSLDAAMDAWGGADVKGDAPRAGRLGLYNLYNLTQWPVVGNARRVRDQAEFLATLERSFYAKTIDYLKNELGAKQLVGPSNMGSADEVRLDDLQRWAWSVADVIELNSFFSTGIKGQHAFWRIQPGHRFTPRSALREPGIPAARRQVVGRPFIVSSTTWTPPNPYSPEAAILNGAYAANAGLDGLLWFAASSATYDTQPYFTFVKVRGDHPMKRWSVSHPGLMTQFPAASLIFRQGLIEQADTVIHEVRTTDELFARRAPVMVESMTYAPSEHAAEALPTKREAMSRARPEAYLIGKVEVAFEGDPSRTRSADLSKYIDPASGAIRTTHGQLVMNRRRGLCLLDAPKAQGAVGFLKGAGGRFDLGDVTIESGNEYASVVVVPLDGKPLARSRTVLVQAGTTAWPTGWQTQAVEVKQKGGGTKQGLEIVSTGTMPWRLANVEATVTIRNSSLVKATKLDEMGFPDGAVGLRASNRGVQVTMPADALYVVLEGR